MKLDAGISAVITGGASGLGEAAARALAAAGVKVALFDMNAERGEAVAAELGGIFCACDVSDPESVAAAFAKARAAHGQERIAVNCAGIVIGAKTASKDRETGEPRAHDPQAFAKVIGVNLIGTFNVASQAAAGMLSLDPITADGERGVIVNTASIAAQDGQIGQLAYATSKGGVQSMSLPMARDLMKDGIRVNAILPGLFGTPMMLGLPDNVQEALGQSVPFPPRLGKPEEYGSLVRFIAENSMLNGEAIRLDGALRMAPR